MRTLQQGLDKWIKRNNFKQYQKEKIKEKKTCQLQKEKFSEADMRELMGTNRPRYSRGKGGAFRQK